MHIVNLLKVGSFAIIRMQLVAAPVSHLNHSSPDLNVFQRFGFFSSSSAESKENVTSEASEDVEPMKATTGEAKEVTNSAQGGLIGLLNELRYLVFLDDFEGLSRDDLVKLVVEKEDLVNVQQEEVKEMQDKVLRTYAEMENLMARTKRNAENDKKFAIQKFATSLLDVADNLGRASSVVKESFSKLDTSKDSAGATPLLKTLLEGVEMTEKQLAEVFKKSGLVKEDPLNERFDPNRHNAVFQVPDASKPEGTIAHVLKLSCSSSKKIGGGRNMCVALRLDVTFNCRFLGSVPGKRVPENIIVGFIGRQYVLRATVEFILKRTLPRAMESMTGKTLKDSIKIVSSFPDMENAYYQLKTLSYELVGDLAIIDISATTIDEGSTSQAMPNAESKVFIECMVICPGFHFDSEEGNILRHGFLGSILGIRAGKRIIVILACVS
ncbi:hypothetical protein F2Q69_00043706 [Brassica cretica]|uniref:GrpE protein homolog n=1 Tax=Brassica cretica TaxID=69181 RepID=A0A8S9NS47_BRACR|nr:hypothetical protein F2Q69_00043706 [Brassica cretica]